MTYLSVTFKVFVAVPFNVFLDLQSKDILYSTEE